MSDIQNLEEQQLQKFATGVILANMFGFYSSIDAVTLAISICKKYNTVSQFVAEKANENGAGFVIVKTN